MTTGSSAITQVQQVARARQPDDPLLADFVAEYLAELPEFDLDERRADDLFASAAAHFELGRVRTPGDNVVVVRSPDGDGGRSVVLIVTDDRPFLVDSVRMVLARHGVGLHLLIHPMLAVARDAAGRLTSVQPLIGADDRRAERVEAWTQIEIDRCPPDLAKQLAGDIGAALSDVQLAVDDFAAMQQRMARVAVADGPLLVWLADQHFVFLGAVTCDLTADGRVVPRPATALGQLARPGALEGDPDPAIDPGGPQVMVARATATSTVHRPARLTAVTVLTTDAAGQPVAERFVGLLASSAYRQSALTIPVVGDRARGVLGLVQYADDTHVGRSIRNVLETLPRDLLFELDAHRLAELVIAVVGLEERQLVRAFAVPEPVGHATTVLVYLPKSRFDAELPDQVARLVGAAYGSPVRDVETLVGESSLARVTLTVTATRPDHPVDLDELAEQLDDATTAWPDRIAREVQRQFAGLAFPGLALQFAAHAPADFRTVVDPVMAVGDLDRLAELAAGDRSTLTALTREVGAPADEWRVRVYRRGAQLSLSRLLPLLGHLGFEALEEEPYEFLLDGEPYHLLDIGVRAPAGAEIGPDRQRELVATVDALLAGRIEADGFNQLVLGAGLTGAQAAVLRAYARYAHQTRFGFSQGYIEGALARHPHVARLLIELFEARFDPDRFDPGRPDPDRPDSAARADAVAVARAAVVAALDSVPSLDDDRICRRFLALIEATLRTSFYRGGATLAFKFDPALVPDLPEPRPFREIFVSSPQVEGVHLRGGPIARGGIRWSDRQEDYRTEVLGLVKAQQVKNSVIVPVGAKGGFVVKQPPADPAELRAAGERCYQAFIRGLLDLTDNVVGDAIVHPDRVVRYDGDDPYLVVAADKGTATFSDMANRIADEYGLWLGDAFASGGSAGYDHKAMAITARGAWESVRSHARALGFDPDADVFTAVGIGDMSGDVFGNGLLRTRTVKLVAAFDHRHVFVDPDPDPDRSYEERLRLFGLPRSTWADYDPALISEGGGVFPRSLKSIVVTPQMRAVLGLPDHPSGGGPEHLAPYELIAAILRAPVDLLWNGGIGTYVKGSTETDEQVGDRANDAVRVDGDELRCRMVAEGGNLGVTQLGRVDYALNGGLINTDAIDNSAGVDCSDHEVNIKILLGAAQAAGELTIEARNALLVEMTGQIVEQVLADNKAQTLALAIARTQGLPMVNVHARYLDALEAEGELDRALEFLPTDKQMAERQAVGGGLTAPEFSVLMAYTKNLDVADLLESDVPDSAVLEADLVAYFPQQLQERYRAQILGHRLRREIAATQLVNQMVNVSGISYDHRMSEDTGASTADVARAWLLTREVTGFPAWWDEIGALTGLASQDQLDLFLDCRRAVERCSLWFLRHRRPPIDVATEIAHLRAPFRALAGQLLGALSGPMADAARARIGELREVGIPGELAERASVWRLLHTTFDVIETAERAAVPPVEAARAYWEAFERLELMWLWDGIGALPRSDRWETQARGALRDDLLSVMYRLTASVLAHPTRSVAGWVETNERSVGRALSLLTDVRRADAYSITNLSVALRTLHNLANMSQVA